MRKNRMEPTDEEKRQLQVDAEDALSRLSGKRPLFVEFAGTPKSGKSSCIDTVNHFFRRLNYSVLAPTEGASKRNPYYLKKDLVSFNAWSATYALTHILEGRFGSDQYNLVIMDRGLFDALAWFELLKRRKDITEKDCLAIQQFLLIDHWRELVDIIFLFKADSETSLNRENQNKLIEEPGITMNPSFLNELNEAYETTRNQYADKFNLFKTLDTSHDANLTQHMAAYQVAQVIVQRLSLGME